MYYNALLCQEIQVYYTTYPDEKYAFDLVNSTLAQITKQVRESEDATSWSSDWQSRFKSTHDNSEGFANVTEAFEQLMDDFPAFKEYSQLNENVSDLLVTFEDIPSVKEIIDMTNANFSNPSIYQKASEYYYDYKEECNDLLSITDAMVEIERFYEQLNGLLNEDETYQLLQATQYLAVALLEDYQKTVHDTVYNCYAYYGDWCDPYSNQEILDLVYSNETLDLINAVGEFYELYDLFWYNFYNSQEYLNLEAEAMEKIQIAINPVLPELENLQEQYTNNINNIPGMKELNEAMNDVVLDIRSESSELDQKLNRMTQLAKDLYYNPTPPTVASTSPASGATNVAVGSNITATFSEAMNASTITTSTFKLNNGATGTVSYNSATRTATFDPSTNLNYSTTYTATMTTGAKDSAGNPMTSNYTWSFTTAPLPDTTPPTVTSTNPINGATNVAVSSNITATFSEAMNASTITTSTFKLNNGATGTVSYNSATRTATFDPSANLNYSTTYTATMTTGAKDSAGNPMTSNYTWSFTTALLPDTTPPTVTSTNPINGATNVAVSSNITATFSEAMNASTITTSTFKLNNGATGTVSYNSATRTATFDPSANLNYSTTYTATITTGAKDAAGNPLTANYQWSFTTGASGTDLFTAYNDLSWSAGQVNDKITLYTTGQGGLLKDYLTGVNTPVTLTVAGGYVVSGTLAQGSNANTGTDAYNIFSGIVNSVGLISYSATNLTFTFTGLDPDLNYEFVLFGNRNDAPYNNRSTTTTISDVTAFTNASTPGTAFSGATDPAVTIVNGDNTANGHVARFTNIHPGADGDILITVSSPTGKFYANALMLRATQSSDTTTPEVSATNPVNNATGVPVNSVVKATFNEAMDADSITPSTFLVSDGITNIGGTVSYSGVTATFTPSGPLAQSTKYTATITTGAKDAAGNPLTANYQWSFTTGASGTDLFTAYNDLAWSAGQVNNKITLYTTGQGGLLKDYLTGANTPVTLTIAGGYVASGTLTQGSNANTGTDAYNIFNGIVNSVGLISYSATNLTFTFTGLDPDLNYEFVLFGNRNNASYNNRSTKTAISDVRAFTNVSTPGTAFSGATDPAVTIVNGDNTANGYVARFTNIIPGADGDMLITVSSPSGGFYANALMLRATQSSETTATTVSTTDVASNSNNGVLVDDSVRTTGKIDDIHKTPETGITLKSFRAKAGRDGRITLHWETPSETDTAGFNLYRSRHKSGRYTKVNNVLINSRDINQSGERYTFTDEPDSGRSHYYKLEHVNAYGDNALYYPIKARMKSPRKSVP
ncbi:conserved hypothetical protein [Candidatus Brocadia pituitae]|nr:conserved hypothetical protein [Candidatus Brocadia pituitae]